MRNDAHRLTGGLAAALVCAASAPALAHVKWFSRTVALQDAPLALSEILTPTFYALAGLSVVVVVALMLLDDPLQKLGPYARLRAFFIEREERAPVVMRVAAGMSLLLSWQADVVLAPELRHDLSIVSWLQFAAILLLLDPRTTPIAGGLVWVLYGIGVALFGPFHMLDYVAFVGIGYYLMFHRSGRPRAHALVKPMLFGCTGLSLCWLALEKLVFPTWGLVLLEQNPTLTLGLPAPFFLTAAAFVELSLGYLLLLGVLGRPLALVITIVFFLTSMVFGKDEVVGHLILHGVLIAFMLEGTRGPLAPPFRFHRSKPLQVAFAAVNFVLLLGVLLVGYQRLAAPRHIAPVAHASETPDHGSADGVDLPSADAPSVTLSARRDDAGRWQLEVETTRFRIGPTAAAPDREALPTEGHAHLYVDGEMRGMIFSSPHDLGPLPPGDHEIAVQLSSADHRTLLVGGRPIESRVTVTQP